LVKGDDELIKMLNSGVDDINDGYVIAL